MAKRVGGSVLRTKTKRGTTYSLRFETGGQRWTHRVGGSWEGWDDDRVDYERLRLVDMIERGEYVRLAAIAPPSSSVGVTTLAVAATDFLERQRVRLPAAKSVADLEWRLRHLIGFYGDVPVIGLTAARFEDFQVAKLQERQAIDEAQAAGDPLLEEYEDARGRVCRRRRRGLGRKQINRILDTLDRLLDDAVRRGELEAHPAPGEARNCRLKVSRKPRSFLELYQADALLRAARQLEDEHRGLTWEKVQLIRSSPLSNVALARELQVSDVLVGKVRRNLIWVDRPQRANRNDVPRLAPIATLLLFGLRVEALCDLDGADVDFARGVVRSSDKTDAGHRSIPMLPAAREILMDHVLNAPCGPADPVFRTRNGRRQSPDNVRSRILAPVVARANEILAAENMPPITSCTPHTLRRTFASMLAEVGVQPRRAMRLLGHENAAFTMNVYQQVLDMPANAEEWFEKVTGATFEQAFDALSERSIPPSFRQVAAENASQEVRDDVS